MNKLHVSFRAKVTPARKVMAVICFLLFLGVEAVAVCFNGVSYHAAIMLALCLCSIVLCLSEFHLPWPVTTLCMLVTPAGYFYLMESMTHIVWNTMKMDAIALNLIFYYLLAFVLYLIVGRANVALIIEAILILFVGAANYYVILFRSTPILPWDLLSLKTAMSVANNYTFSMDHLFAVLVGGFLFLIVLYTRMPAFRLAELSDHKWVSALFRLVLICLLMVPTVVYVNFLFQPDIDDKTSLDATLFTPRYMYRTNGFFVAFIMDLRFLQISAPDGYSVHAAEALLDEHTPDTSAPDVLPNVIVIMNECFSDPSVLGEFGTNMDYMPNVSALLDGAENTISGHLYASVLGGNTANSEYEFLTGNTMAFLPNGSVPYQQYIHSEIPSIVDQFEALGYHTVAMHPYNAGGWNRNRVYPWMHFDQMLFYNNFTDRVKLRNYVSDASNYENVLNIYNSSEDPVFIFNVTMQNHSGYGDAYDNFTPLVTAELVNTKSNRYLNNYLSLIQVADEAVGDLLATLEDSDKPTIVVFFGDHQPNDYVISPIYKENGMDINNQTLKQQQDRQIVPFFIWANYDIEEASGLSVSINYLSSLLFKAAGLPMSSYQTFLYDLYQQIPVLNSVGYIDNDDQYYYLQDAAGDTKKLFDHYKILQYYKMFD